MENFEKNGFIHTDIIEGMLIIYINFDSAPSLLFFFFLLASHMYVDWTLGFLLRSNET